MGRRARARGRGDRLRAPESEYTSAAGDVLVLRGALTPATRRQYGEVLHGHPLSREDAWQRAVEFLFERLAVSLDGERGADRRASAPCWRACASPRPTSGASCATSLREHVAEHFPELEAP